MEEKKYEGKPVPTESTPRKCPDCPYYKDNKCKADPKEILSTVCLLRLLTSMWGQLMMIMSADCAVTSRSYIVSSP